MLLVQTQMEKANKGMLVALIEFAKAYDKVEQHRMWGCLGQLSINGRILRFLRLYTMTVYVKWRYMTS